jgi:hypothetical protein
MTVKSAFCAVATPAAICRNTRPKWLPVGAGSSTAYLLPRLIERVRFPHDGRVVVEVHQIVRDLDGNVLPEKTVGHVFQMENQLIRRFDSRGS